MNKEDYMARSKKKEVADVIEEITTEEAIDILEEEIAKEEEKPKPVRKKNTTKQGIVRNCGLLNVRENPSVQARALKQITANTRVEIIGEENNFYKIADGYVMKDFVDIV